MQNYDTPQWMLEQGFSPTFANRFWAKVEKTPTCWIWTGGISANGYGSIRIGVKGTPMVRGNRASWMLHNGPIPPGKLVCHNCPDGDNSLCVNPGHLWLGTYGENSEDMAQKGRACSGENNHKNILKLADVQTVLSLYFEHNMKTIDISRIYGVHPTTIGKIIVGRNWKRHVCIPI